MYKKFAQHHATQHCQYPHQYLQESSDDVNKRRNMPKNHHLTWNMSMTDKFKTQTPGGSVFMQTAASGNVCQTKSDCSLIILSE